jgi:RHS repeat-associated protein
VRNALEQVTGDVQTGSTNPTTLGLGYDSAYQLTSRSNSAAGTSSSYTTDNADELTGLATTTNGATTQNLSFTYDRDGNRLTQHDSVSGASATYGYDQADRLTSFSGGGHTASYSYDGDGLRQSKTVDSTTTTTFTWDQSGSLPLLIQAGSTSYIDGPDGHPIEQISGSTPSYYLYDALGSVRGVLSATGGYTGYSYDPYGAVTSGNTPTADYFGFAGEYTDAETGFEYLQARYYDPNTGEFLSVDPFKDLTGQPYAYAGDNPLTWTDPSGLCPWYDPLCLRGEVEHLFNVVSSCVTGPGACLQATVDAIGSTTWGRNLLEGVENFDNSDLSNTVFDMTVGEAATVKRAAFACAADVGGCGEVALAWQLDLVLHPWKQLPAYINYQAAKFVLGELNQVRTELCTGHYGALAGQALVDFVEIVGPGEIVGAVGRGAEAETSAGFRSILEADGIKLPDDEPSTQVDQTGTGGCGCFPGNTSVQTPHGLVAIASLHVGDLVLAEDPKSDRVEPEPVQAVIDDGIKPLMHVQLSDGTSLSVTTDHPFYVDSGPGISTPQWVQAGNLQKGDRLRTEDGHDVMVTALRHDMGYANVYTLTVAQDHTFFVGTGEPVLVHNCEPAAARVARLTAQQGSGTLVELEIDPGTYSGKNAHTTPITLRVNAQTVTHAEAEAFQKALNAHITGKEATIYVGRNFCGACGRNGGVAGLARQLGIERLTVYSPETLPVGGVTFNPFTTTWYQALRAAGLR